MHLLTHFPLRALQCSFLINRPTIYFVPETASRLPERQSESNSHFCLLLFSSSSFSNWPDCLLPQNCHIANLIKTQLFKSAAVCHFLLQPFAQTCTDFFLFLFLVAAARTLIHTQAEQFGLENLEPSLITIFIFHFSLRPIVIIAIGTTSHVILSLLPANCIFSTFLSFSLSIPSSFFSQHTLTGAATEWQSGTRLMVMAAAMWQQ